MKEFIMENVAPHISAFIGAILSGVAGFLFGRKKQKAEVEALEVNTDTIEIANADKIIAMYQKTLDDLQVRYEAKFKEITALYEEKIKLMQDEITILKRSIKQLKEENAMLRERLKENNLE
nr:MAG TPA: YtxH-like protein [Caudoviricetes sp.]